MCALRSSDRLFVALDTPHMDGALSLAGSLAGLVGGIKLGKAFFTANGPQGVRRAAGGGLPVFLDLKFHDIPNTVADAVRAALALAPVMLTVHASGGAAMMRAAADAAEEAGANRPLVLGVTVLTSLGADDLAATGLAGPVPDQVMRLARLAQASGLDGVVCSAREVAALRAECGAAFKLVVPGIRPAGAAAGDQKRTATPAEAIAAGADYLVIGRPLTGADDPAQAARAVIDEIEVA